MSGGAAAAAAAAAGPARRRGTGTARYDGCMMDDFDFAAHAHQASMLIDSVERNQHIRATQVWPGAYARGRAAAAMGWRPLRGLRVILHGGKKLRPPVPFMAALVEAGGGEVLSISGVSVGEADPQTTVALSSPTCKADRAIQAWVAKGGVVLAAEMLLDFVSKEQAPDPADYCLFGTPRDAAALSSLVGRCMRWTPPPPLSSSSE